MRKYSLIFLGLVFISPAQAFYFDIFYPKTALDFGIDEQIQSITKVSSCRTDGSKEIWNFVFDRDGTLLKQTLSYKDKNSSLPPSYQQEITFNRKPDRLNQYIQQYLTDNGDQTTSSYQTMAVDSSGKPTKVLLEVISHHAKREDSTSPSFDFQGEGQLADIIKNWKNKRKVLISVQYLDGLAIATSKEKSPFDGDIKTMRSVIEFDAFGRKTQVTIEDPATKRLTPLLKIEYAEDSPDHRIVTIESSQNGNIEFRYDDDKKLMTTLYKDSLGIDLPQINYSDYEYDQCHNWTKMTVTRPNLDKEFKFTGMTSEGGHSIDYCEDIEISRTIKYVEDC